MIGEPNREVLLTDLDNTLYNWIDYWVPAFRALVVSLSKQSGIPLTLLLSDFAAVFRRHESVEYSFALEELDTLQRAHPELTSAERAKLYWPAIEEFQIMRRRILRPYREVQEVLEQLHLAGVRIYGVTEGAGFQVRARLHQLNIGEYFTAVYTVPENAIPAGLNVEEIRRHPLSSYQADVDIRYIPEGLRKPNPRLLEHILIDLGTDRSKIAYLGDSLDRDIFMAKQCDVFAIWAKYGTLIDRNNLRTLLSVTHWAQEDVKRSVGRPDSLPQPDFIVETPMSILSAFSRRLLGDYKDKVDGHINVAHA